VRIALNELPEGVQAEVEGDRAVVTYGDPEAPTVVSVAHEDGVLILFPARSYKQADLAKALGRES